MHDRARDSDRLWSRTGVGMGAGALLHDREHAGSRRWSRCPSVLRRGRAPYIDHQSARSLVRILDVSPCFFERFADAGQKFGLRQDRQMIQAATSKQNGFVLIERRELMRFHDALDNMNITLRG